MDSYASRDYAIPRTYTSSEALKWTMTSSPSVPLRSNMNFSCYVKPPFATGFDEVNKQKKIAVPKLRQQYSKYNPPKPASPYPPTQPRFHLYNMAKENQFQRPSSYSTRKFSWPSYNSLNDPHMQEYFLKRFGRCKTDITIRKSSMNRSQSTGSTTSRLSQNHLRRSRSQTQSNTSVFYKVSVSTGDKKNCGTAAKIFLTVNGTYGKINRTQLIKKKSKKSKTTSSPFYFSKDSTNVFKINSHDIGDIKSIFIENSGTKKKDAWFLDTVEISNSTKKKSWTFLCYQWLSLYHSDGHSERKLFPHKLVKTDYEVVTVTGDVVGAGTNANVFITLFGKQGISQKLHLKSKKLCFQRNQSDSFRVKTNRIDPLVKIRIEHDNTGYCPGWFLERIVVTDVKGSKIPYYFPCGKWLAKDEEDGNISRDIFGSSNPLSKTKDNIYKVTVFTGNVKGAGTDACVYITLFGELSDSGECRLRSAKNNFERGKVDEFLVKCPCLGPLKSIRIGHDNSGFGAGWFLDKVIIDDKGQDTVYKFICNRWLATDEDDGQTFRDLFLSVGPNTSPIGYSFTIMVVTGDMRNAGTDSNVFISLYDCGKIPNSSGKIWLRGGKLSRGKTDIFNVNISQALSPLSKIEIGHDNSGRAPGWLLDHVVVECPSTGIKQVFPCNRWLALDEDDGLIQRTIYEEKSLRKKAEQMLPWSILVYTGTKNGAGTDANVSLIVYGDKAKSDKISLANNSDNFERGATDQFRINMIDIGIPYKLRIWHDDSGSFPGWFLAKIELENLATKRQFIFHCNRWLASDEDDNQIVRELPATGQGIKNPLPVLKYKVEVFTGDVRGAGTDADIFLNIFGVLGDTGERILAESKKHKNKFERGQMDEFEIEAVSLMELKKIKIGHDSKYPGSGWFLNKVIITPRNGQDHPYIFECNRWFAVDEDDGQTKREIFLGSFQMLKATTYNIQIKTGDVRGGGTDANVFIKMFGLKGDTGILKLTDSENHSNKFEQGHIDMFKIEAADIGKIQRIQIGHDDSYPGAGWFLDEVRVDIPSKGEHYVFACHRWLARDENDGQIEITLEPTKKEKREKFLPYEVTVWTGTKNGAGTDANVFIRLFGKKAKTEQYFLRNKANNFEAGSIDKFKLETSDVGQLLKIQIGHDGKGALAGWFLEKKFYLDLRRQHQTQDSTPITTRQLESLIRLTEARARVELREEATKQDAEDLLIQHLRNDKDHKRDSVAQNRGKTYRPSSSTSNNREERTVTRPLSSRSAQKDSWFKEDEGESEKGSPKEEVQEYWFFINRWFSKQEDDGAIVREFVPTDSQGKPLPGTAEEIEYTIKVVTGDVMGAGTDANVFVNIYGENGDTSDRQLSKSDHINKFERKQEDVFTLKAVDLGKLIKLKIYHDNKGGGAAWFLDHVEVTNTKTKESYLFPCQKWLSTKDDDGQISRELVPVNKSLKIKNGTSSSIREETALETKAATTTYYIKVITGDVWGAGTDANVYIILYGNIDNTGQKWLKSSIQSKNKFERGNMDEFVLEVVNIGELKKIKIGHDNSGYGGAWFLEKVIIDCPSLGKTWTFQCGRWLSLDADDGRLEKELYPQEMATKDYNPNIPYEISTYTGDMMGASTDADVFVVVYGKTTSTQQKFLCANKKERKQRFKRNSVDKFIVEMEDIGDDIEKIRIGHNEAGFGSGWFLSKVEIRKLNSSGKGSQTFSFPCNRWLARDEDDGSIERELVPDKLSQEVLGKNGQLKRKESIITNQLTAMKYVVCVYTGDVRGGGTDANVFLTLFGDKGDTGERKLLNSETYRNKFERNQMDRFTLEAIDLGQIYKIHIRHDNSLISPAWYLEKVEISEISLQKTFVFHCERWLAKNKDDGKIERTLYVKGYDGDMSESCATLNSQSLSKYGSVSSLDSSKGLSKQFTKQMTRSLEHIPEGSMIPYKFRIRTGSQEDHGTDSNVWIKVFGLKKKHTGNLSLNLLDKERFEPGSIETFTIEAVDVEEIKKIEIGHDGTSPSSGWFLKDIEIDVPTKGKHYHFVCNDWLAQNKGDGKTVKILNVKDDSSSVVSYKALVPYEVTVITGDLAGAGTDSKIFMTVFGEKGISKPVEFAKIGNYFERGQVNSFKIELEDISPLKKIRMSIDGSNSRPDWYLSQVDLLNMKTDEKTIFLCEKWFSAEKEDKKLRRDIPALDNNGKPVIPYTIYKIKIKTSDIYGAGTSSGVFLILFGVNGDSGEIPLQKPINNNNNPFQRGQLDIFEVNDILSLGKLSKLRIWHNNKGIGSAWHLSFIEVVDSKPESVYTFHCDKWLSTSKDDDGGQTIRELTCSEIALSTNIKQKTEYSIKIITSDKRDSGTIHNGWLILEGEEKTSKIFHMINSPERRIFCRGGQDDFHFVSESLGQLKSCLVGIVQQKDFGNISKQDRKWLCSEIFVTDETTGTKFSFVCKEWIEVSNKISKSQGMRLNVKNIEESQVSKVRKLTAVKYNVRVFTGDEKNSGTNANVFLTLYGENGDTGKRPLKQRFRDLFERKQMDSFVIESIDLGELTSLLIEHDNSGFHPGWFLSRIEITNSTNNDTVIFPCEKWLDKEKGDGLIARELFPQPN